MYVTPQLFKIQSDQSGVESVLEIQTNMEPDTGSNVVIGTSEITTTTINGTVTIGGVPQIPTPNFYIRNTLSTPLGTTLGTLQRWFSNANFTVSNSSLNGLSIGGILNTSNLIVPYTGMWNINGTCGIVTGASSKFTLQSISGTYGTDVIRTSTNAAAMLPNIEWTGYLATSDVLQLQFTPNFTTTIPASSNTSYTISLLTKLS
jgi:hypothetical protein